MNRVDSFSGRGLRQKDVVFEFGEFHNSPRLRWARSTERELLQGQASYPQVGAECNVAGVLIVVMCIWSRSLR
jgi:hypothetical protein